MTYRTGLPLFTTILLIALPAAAQDTGSYQLPPASSPTPTVQGPVVPDAPPPRPAATTEAAPAEPARVEPSPAPSPTPTIALPSPPTARAAPRPATAPLPSPPPEPESAPTPLVESQLPATAPTPAPAPASPIETTGNERNFWPWLLGALALAALGGLALLFQRREKALPEPAFTPPRLPETTPPRTTAPVAAAAAAAPPLALRLDAVRMNASLINATLSYRLLLTAGADIGPVELRADMTAAHASRAAVEQLGAADAPVLHRLAGLAAGETAVLEGEIRLPLATITPIRHGGAALFVPLVRIAVEAASGSAPLRLRRAFVVGLDESGASGRLQPFRLDQGPRSYGTVGHRELTVPQFA